VCWPQTSIYLQVLPVSSNWEPQVSVGKQGFAGRCGLWSRSPLLNLQERQGLIAPPFCSNHNPGRLRCLPFRSFCLGNVSMPGPRELGGCTPMGSLMVLPDGHFHWAPTVCQGLPLLPFQSLLRYHLISQKRRSSKAQGEATAWLEQYWSQGSDPEQWDSKVTEQSLSPKQDRKNTGFGVQEHRSRHIPDSVLSYLCTFCSPCLSCFSWKLPLYSISPGLILSLCENGQCSKKGMLLGV
jgi:hypothetical protein